jgi:hypothetical protein
MKKLIFVLSIIITSFSFAQIESFDSTYIEGLKSDVAGTFREIVTNNMKLTADEAKIFWPIFDEYMAERNPIFDEKVNITEDYMMNYYSLDTETAMDLIHRTIKLNQDLLDLRTKYLDRMSEQLPVQVVGKFFQIDNRVSTLADLVRMSSTPLVRDEE